MNDTKREYQEFPVYENSLEANYVDGYVPVSYEAPHSSLVRSITWIGMGLVLASLAGFGTLLFGLASNTVGSQSNWDMYAMIGAVLGVGMLVVGFAAIYVGRRNLREWRARTGRKD
ncbi:membrane protein [Corynebacterium epidermidicanis]|uniref:Uncharacterized protein n=1 Tax=Corynebacterium epidermidicanis TaxID=1050174 RepID=A0A0G3GYZ0_9CORY|nr:membrane protein [Corynebacterium epidermidicanis]AKK04072.1 hypothetical protein CEPID_11215 [Corynebacterium epidermidicanis]